MSSFLENILVHKQEKIESKKNLLPFSALYSMVKRISVLMPFSFSLLDGKRIIAEIKKASPSRGAFFLGDRVFELGRIYESCGASSISIVTEERYFLGNLRDLQRLRASVQTPILRKDFIIDE